MKGILARKVGMTSYICPDSGQMSPITVLEVNGATVLQVKTAAKDGYCAAVLGAFTRKNFGKNENKKFKFIQEVTLENSDEVKRGDEVSLEVLKDLDFVKVTATSKGRGFAGVIKRYGFSRGPETHGSHHHREPGSVGMCAKPARILKGKKMPGRMGADKITLRDVRVLNLDLDDGLIALKGPVPGAKGGFVFLRGK